MRRPGFFLPSAVGFLFLVVLLAGLLAERVSLHVAAKVEHFSFHDRLHAVRIVLEAGEAWLVGLAEGGHLSAVSDLPVARADIFRKIPPDAPAFAADISAWPEIESEVYVACAEEAVHSTAHAVPRILPAVSADGIVRYYFLQSRARGRGEENWLVAESLLEISTNHAGALQDVRRLFYRKQSRID